MASPRRLVVLLVAIVVTIVAGAAAGARGLDAYAKSRVTKAAADLGVQLTAERATYAVLNVPNDDNQKGPDIVLREVTLRVRGDGSSVRAKTMSIYFMPARDKAPTWTRVELLEPAIEMEGSAKVLAAGARVFQERGDTARSSAPVSLVLRNGTALVRGISGPGSKVELRFQYASHDVGMHEHPSVAEGDFTLSAGNTTEGPHALVLNPQPHRGEGKHELRLTCGATVAVLWADDAEATLAAAGPADCPGAIDVLTTLGARKLD